MTATDLNVTLGPLKLKNPVMPASGTYGWVTEFEAFYNPAILGAVIPKTITLKPRQGNKPQRIVETAGGMLNSIGLQNPGFEKFASEYWPVISRVNTVHIINIAGETIEEFAELAQKTAELDGIDALELNASCPNVNRQGQIFGTETDRTRELVQAVKQVTDLPLLVKMTPNVTDITAIAKAAEEGGADILSLTNTLLGMAIDSSTGAPVIENIRAGLSGPAIKPVALRMVFDTSRAVQLPIIGIGGITNARDAVEFMMAGASAVQIGTANFTNPEACRDIIKGIAEILAEQGINRVQDIIGKTHTMISA